MIYAKNISFSYKTKSIFSSVSFSVFKGQILTLLGPNGTGKTTLLKCLMGVYNVDSGKVFIEKNMIQSFSRKDLAKQISYVPQYFDNIGLSDFSVMEFIMMGRMPYVENIYSELDKDIVVEIIDEMKLTALAFRNMRELSGGERQRVYIARAIAQQPKAVLLDEPTSSLDLNNQLLVMQMIENLAKKKNIAIIMTMHDINLASLFSDRIILFKDKKLFKQGSVKDVITEENIKAVYGVDTYVNYINGYPSVALKR